MYVKSILAVLLSLLFVGCASIPPEAPQLSTELGKRIFAIESANIKLLNKFFDQKRKEVDRFILEEWTPEFAENIFSNPKMLTLWNQVVKENNKHDRLMFITKLGPELQMKINKKRLDLIAPLDQLQRTIESQIRHEYTQAKAMNNSITSLLLSASEVTQNTDRYLNMIGVSNEKIGNIIDETDEMVASLLDKSNDASNKVDRVEKFIKKVKELKNKI